MQVDGGFRWPVRGRISGVYGSQRFYNGTPGSPHYGVDIAVPTGTPVHAPAAGRVTLAEPDLFYSGGTVILDHGYGLSSSFLHMSEVSVAVGDTLDAGDLIGAVGATGRATGAHLDWRMSWRDRRVDPQRLVPPMPATD
jgi:murein DD-endopeptidase MepM/ murein hydrolase activator NlpD